MPSETMDFNSLSSSLYSSEDICSSTEKQAGFWKSDNLPKYYDSDRGIKPSLNVQPVSNFSDSSEANVTASQHERSLFSSSLSELFCRKLRLSANSAALYGHSVDTVASHYEEEKLFDSLEELEAQIIGNLLPSDDDLLSGVTDGHDHTVQDSSCNDIDELDLFSSVGGMDLGDDDRPSSGQKNSEILGGVCDSELGCNVLVAGEHPSRTLFVRNINSDVEDFELKALFEQFGDIHTLDTACKHHGFVTISYYDIRAAQNAMRAYRNGLFSSRKFVIHYSIPKVGTSQSGDSKRCFSMVQQICPESEQKKCNLYLHQKSPPVKVPTSFPGLSGVIKSGSMDGGRIMGVEPAMCTPSLETAFIHGVSSSVPNTLPSLVRVKSVGSQCEITESSSPGQLNFDIPAASTIHPHSLPEFHDGLAIGGHRNPPEANINLKTQERIDNMQFCQVNSNRHFMKFNECGNGSHSLPGNHYKWSNSYQLPGMMWPNSPSYFDGICAAPTLPRLHGLSRSPSHVMSTVLPINNQHVPSAIWDRRHTYAGESPKASAFHPGSLGNMQFSSNTAARCVDFVPHNIFSHFGGSCVDLQILPDNLGLHFHNQRGLMFPGRNHMVNSFDTHKQRVRSRRNEGASNLADKTQYELDIDHIKKGEDNRTTLMIKNIPNK
ncbi:RNA-binding domain superfamily [Sesbania bispinosa]|nr:RNA-binding domain superfamily [Sesbania bispinosa]